MIEVDARPGSPSELGIDRVELRRRTSSQADDFPSERAIGVMYDSATTTAGRLDARARGLDAFRKEPAELPRT